VTVIRPPVLHGAGARGNVGRLASALRRGVPLPLASIRNRRAFLGIDNFVGFVNWRLSTPNAWCETFIVADDVQPSTPYFVALLGAAIGRRARLVPFPPALLRRALLATGRGAMAEGLLSSLEVDTTKAKAAGWRPRFTLAEGLDRAFATDASGAGAQATGS
jgi:UDP-glucose 4-epimerase